MVYDVGLSLFYGIRQIESYRFEEKLQVERSSGQYTYHTRRHVLPAENNTGTRMPNKGFQLTYIDFNPGCTGKKIE